jgi:hypothetical protein
MTETDRRRVEDFVTTKARNIATFGESYDFKPT